MDLRKKKTYVNVQLHAITLGATDSGRDDYQRVHGHKVADAPLLLLVLPARVRLDVEFEGAGDTEQHEQADQAPRQESLESHCLRQLSSSSSYSVLFALGGLSLRVFEKGLLLRWVQGEHHRPEGQGTL